MPNRILHGDILLSRQVNQLRPQAELFFRRLWSVVDDYGRFHADPTILRASCYPLRTDEVREADISRWLAEVQTAGLIALYAVDEVPYLEVPAKVFRQQIRAAKSQFPPPPGAATRSTSECVADAKQMRPESETESETKSEAKARAETGEPEGGSRPPAPPARSRSSQDETPRPPTEDEWVRYASKRWPDWPGNDVRSSWSHFKARGWRGVSDWQASADSCYHRQAAGPPRRPAPPLVGAHPPAKAPEPEDEAPGLPPPPPPPEGEGNVLPDILGGVKAEVDDREFDDWLRPLRQSGPADKHLAIVAPSLAAARVVREEYLRAIADAALERGIGLPIRLFAEDGREVA